jgi:RNA polymerase sigma-70 factor (ECF subfamily)
MTATMTTLPDPSPRTGNDADLAERIAGGDRGAFEPLMRRHNQLLYRIARSILRDDAEAEDAVQEAWLSAFRNFDRFRGDSALSTWLARIAINESYARLRARKRRAEVVTLDSARTDDEFMESNGMADDNSEQPDMAAFRGELRGLLESRIDALPEQFRTVYVLRDVQEMSVEETAACLDLPAATVRTRAFRARALLRESLARDIDAATVRAFGFAGARCDRIVATVLRRLDEAS